MKLIFSSDEIILLFLVKKLMWKMIRKNSAKETQNTTF